MYVLPARWKNRLHRAFRGALVVYTLLCVGMYFFQDSLLFHPSPLPADYKFKVKLPFEEKITNVEGESIHSLLVHPAAPRGLILYFHGNGDNLSQWSEVAEDLANKLQYDVWAMDYPGYGKSTGKPRSEAQMHAVTAGVFADAKKEASGRPLVLFGRSVGTGFAVKIASENPVSALVLESPFLSIQTIAQRDFWWAPTFLLRYPLNSAALISQVKSPILVLHGNDDEVIPFADGKALAALTLKAKLVTIEGGHHNDLSYNNLYWAELATFFENVPLPISN